MTDPGYRTSVVCCPGRVVVTVMTGDIGGE
ncbi:Uncharacterised protein [Rhodococcus gordoniae]|uniref:Uncharacterized protein n=1 Tax=Rhodococcus gordoniae TaxID=223392 RepID=A0A379LVL0_9NOCA|nr:Uncharacterised protein [Rhodococcus gordoniae]